eukprot:3615389-Pleurochrysis_carterae.AAC.1
MSISSGAHVGEPPAQQPKRRTGQVLSGRAWERPGAHPFRCCERLFFCAAGSKSSGSGEGGGGRRGRDWKRGMRYVLIAPKATHVMIAAKASLANRPACPMQRQAAGMDTHE